MVDADPIELDAWRRALAVQADVQRAEVTPEGFVSVTYSGERRVLPHGWLVGAQGGSAALAVPRGPWPVEIVHCRCRGAEHSPGCPCDDGAPVAVPAPPPAVADTEVAVLDTETTGLERDARVTEVAVVIVALPSGRIVRRSAQLVDPGCPIPATVTRLTGITDAMVQGKPAIADLWPRIVAAVGDRPVVAHHAAFDRGRLEYEVDRVAATLPSWRWWCSKVLAARVIPGRKMPKAYSLQTLATDLRLSRGKAHRALGDCLTTAALLHHLARGRAWAEWAGEPAAVWAPRAWSPTLEGVA